MAFFRETLEVVKATGKGITNDDVPAMSASIAYFALLSLPPLLAILVMIAGAFFADEQVAAALTGQLGDVLGEDGAQQIDTMLQGARDVGAGSLIGQIIGIAALVLGATGAFGQLQRSLNKAWRVEPDPDESGIKNFLMKRVLSFGMVLTIGFLLAISLVASTVIQALSAELGELIGGAGWALIQIADVGLPLVIFTLLFAAMFKVLPDAVIEWRDVWVGAFVTAVLFTAGKYVISLYIGQTEVGAAFGAAGSLVVVLVWIFFSAFILLVGAEFTQVWARRYGKQIIPDEGAVRVVNEHRIIRDRDEDESSPRPAGDDEPVHPYLQGRSPNPRSGAHPEDS